MKIFGKHRVRASFYHITAGLFLSFTALQFLGVLNHKEAFYLTSVLFVLDYLAEMFDPHPDNMGSWYERYFHRIFEDDTE